MNKQTLHISRVRAIFCLVQRLLLMLFLSAMLLMAYAQSNARERRDSSYITMVLDNAPIEKAFSIIKQQTPYRVIYDNSLLKSAKPVTISVAKAKLSNVLNLLFSGQPFEYRVMDQSIIVTPRKPGLHRLPPEINNTPPFVGKDTIVTGTVVADSTLMPLAGATVTIKETNISTATDNMGKFRLSVPEAEATLVISYVGYTPQTIRVNKSSGFAISIVLAKTPQEMEEVTVVNTGYQDIPKERATGSFEKVDNELFNRSVSTGTLQRLEGIVPGVVFNRMIGRANPTISIRGISTLNSDQNPLIILDNFPYNGNINNINPNDVENVSILKDAAAASIWGAKAGNGVIVITTKKGKYNQKMNLSFNTNVTVVDKPDLFYIPQFSSSEFIEVEKFLFDKNFYNAQLNNANGLFPATSPVVQILAQRRDGLITSADSAAQLSAFSNYDIRNEYLKYLYRKAVNQQNSLTLTGGSNNINYLFSFGYDKNLTSLIGNEQERITINSQTRIKPVKNIEIRVGVLYTSYNLQNNSAGGNITWAKGKQLYPYARLADDHNNPVEIQKDYRSAFTDTVGNGNLLDWKYRPLDELKNADNTSGSQDILLNLGASFIIGEGISAEVKYQYEKQISNSRNYYSSETYYARNLINLFTPTGEAISNSAVPFGGILNLTNTNLSSHSVRGQLNFNKNWSGKNELFAIAGSEVRGARITENSSRTYGYNDEVITYQNVDFVNSYPTYLDLAETTTIPNFLDFTDASSRFVSFYGNAAYTYSKRYTITASGRKDASKLFWVKANNKWKPLWSVGGAWKISREKFYAGKHNSELNLRMSYGFSGNVNNSIPAILTLSSFYPDRLTNLPTYLVNNPPNPSLKWENVRMINIGLDFSLFKGRFSGSFEYYTKKSTDLIAPTPFDITSGYSSLTVNAANLVGKGIDISINTINLNKGLKWQTTYWISYNTNKVSKYLYKQNRLNSYIGNGSIINPIEGQNAYEIISWKWAGLDPENGDPQGYLNKVISKDYFSMADGATLDDIVFHGSSRPLYFGAIKNSLSFKGLTLSANITYRFRYYFRRPDVINYFTLRSFYVQNGYSDYVNRWQKPGDETKTDVPSFVYPPNSSRDNFYAQSEVTVEKGDHFRFQDINISYDFHEIFWKSVPVKALTIYFYANNIGLIWKANKAGLDPDYGTPPPKSFAVGIRARF